jgi:hypothetical protein
VADGVFLRLRFPPLDASANTRGIESGKSVSFNANPDVGRELVGQTDSLLAAARA